MITSLVTITLTLITMIIVIIIVADLTLNYNHNKQISKQTKSINYATILCYIYVSPAKYKHIFSTNLRSVQ